MTILLQLQLATVVPLQIVVVNRISRIDTFHCCLSVLYEFVVLYFLFLDSDYHFGYRKVAVFVKIVK